MLMRHATFKTTFSPTVIGQFAGGGYYAGDITVGSNVYKILMAPANVGQDISDLFLRTSRAFTPGTSSLTDGWANTLVMIAEGVSIRPAAAYCRSLNIDGYIDWYLPSKNELNLIYQNKSVLDAVDTTGALVGLRYWSSSEPYSDYGWYQHFADGLQNVSSQNSGGIIRAVRRF